MFQLIRTRGLTLVRTSRIAQITVAIIALLTIAITVYAYNAKTINVHIDGKTVHLTTISGTVGQALTYSNLECYPEDTVTPPRDTKLTNGLNVEVTRSIPVKLSVDNQTFSTRTVAKTVGEALLDLSKRFGLQIKDVDEVNVARSEALVPDMDIKVRRAVPITVRVDGKTINTYIAPRTVQNALKKLGITLGQKDKVSLPLNQMIKPDDQIQVVRVTEKVETIKSEIPYQTISQPGDFPVGLPDRVISYGADGLQEQTVKVTLEDGKEVDSQILAQHVLAAPRNQVVSRGEQTSVSRGGITIHFKRAYVMTATAYCDPGGITRSGEPVHWGVVAVDPRVIPLGSRVYVEGYGEGRALDTGGAIRGNRIDLYMNSYETAASWGARKVRVYVQ
jgi:uncharacterized protein YabE (DUF348 family)